MAVATQSTTALWFSIETAFAEVQELCVRARAAQLTVERAAGPANPLQRTMASGGLKQALESPPEEDPRLARAADLARDLAFREQNSGGPDLVLLRALVRKRLVGLKASFAAALADHDVYYALFPIVVHFDELVQIGTRSEASRWEPLQSELFDVDNGGELFFTILDDRLTQAETHPVILEIFYFCLSDGFAGMYQGDPKKLGDFKARLTERIPVRPVAAGEDDGGPRSVELVAFPWQYYVFAAAAVAAAYALFTWLSIPSS